MDINQWASDVESGIEAYGVDVRDFQLQYRFDGEPHACINAVIGGHHIITEEISAGVNQSGAELLIQHAVEHWNRLRLR